jgi:rRNA-processing protein FCF1
VLRELDRRRAERAGLLVAPGEARGELSLADRAVLAALDEDDRLATSDERLARAARELGFEVVALPGRHGVA